MTTQHTPGTIHRISGNLHVCYLTTLQGQVSEKALRDAAPELLVALTTLLDRVDRKRYNIRADFDFFVADAAARAASAKAVGG